MLMFFRVMPINYFYKYYNEQKNEFIEKEYFQQNANYLLGGSFTYFEDAIKYIISSKENNILLKSEYLTDNSSFKVIEIYYYTKSDFKKLLLIL